MKKESATNKSSGKAEHTRKSKKRVKRKHKVSFFMFIVVFLVNDDAYVLKIFKHMMPDEDDVISTRILASIDFHSYALGCSDVFQETRMLIAFFFQSSLLCYRRVFSGSQS